MRNIGVHLGTVIIVLVSDVEIYVAYMYVHTIMPFVALKKVIHYSIIIASSYDYVHTMPPPPSYLHSSSPQYIYLTAVRSPVLALFHYFCIINLIIM